MTDIGIDEEFIKQLEEADKAAAEAETEEAEDKKTIDIVDAMSELTTYLNDEYKASYRIEKMKDREGFLIHFLHKCKLLDPFSEDGVFFMLKFWKRDENYLFIEYRAGLGQCKEDLELYKRIDEYNEWTFREVVVVTGKHDDDGTVAIVLRRAKSWIDSVSDLKDEFDRVFYAIVDNADNFKYVLGEDNKE